MRLSYTTEDTELSLVVTVLLLSVTFFLLPPSVPKALKIIQVSRFLAFMFLFRLEKFQAAAPETCQGQRTTRESTKGTQHACQSKH